MKFQHGQRLDTWATLEELGPGDRITVDGKPATVFDVEEGDEIYIVYVLDGKKSKKELSMFDALLPSETSEDEEEEWDPAFGEPDPDFVEKPEVEVRYIAPGKDLFDEPGLRKSPGRRNRPMTSHVPPVAEGKIRITKGQLRKLIREATGSTKKYDDDSALKGDQSELPDDLQKGIIDKTVEDREEAESKEANEVRRLIRSILSERGSGNPALQAEEQALRIAVANFVDKYMMTMGMNPSDDRDMQRARRVIDDMVGAVMDVL